MADHKNHLSGAYKLTTQDETNAYYDDWAETYDAELIEAGYATPERCASALAQHVTDKDIALLDVGCGTGMSGAALAKAGFTNITGSDVSAGMLTVAEQRGVYRAVLHADADDPFPFETGVFGAMSAVGVVGAGAAPRSVLEGMMEKTAPGGLLVFSFNDKTLTDPAFVGFIDGEVSAGRFEILFQEHGPHIPAKNLDATVYVLKAS